MHPLEAVHPAPPPPSRPGTGERGLTLTELVIVGLLAMMVMMALTAFYISSQQVWMDGSTQAMAQRDGSLLVETLRRRVHEAQQASVVTNMPDSLHDQLSLQYASGNPISVDFRWNSGDQRVHLIENGSTDRGAIADTPVSRFRLTTLNATMVELTQLQLRTANGDSVSLTSRFVLLGG